MLQQNPLYSTSFLLGLYFRYCAPVLDNCGNWTLQKFQNLQNRAARVVTNSPYEAPSLPLIKQLCWLDIQRMINIETTNIVPNSLHNEVPDYLQGLFTMVSDKCNWGNHAIPK